MGQVFGDLGFDASLHGYPIRYGRSSVGGLREDQEATEENGLQEHCVMPHGHTVAPEKVAEVEERAVAPF